MGLLKRLRDLDDRVLPPGSRQGGLERLAAMAAGMGIFSLITGRWPVALFLFALGAPAGVVALLDRRRQRRA